MEIISLQFQTPQALTSFRKLANIKVIRTDVTELVIYCECTPENMELAMKHYGAVVKKEPGKP
jgi:hypothetical protein